MIVEWSARCDPLQTTDSANRLQLISFCILIRVGRLQNTNTRKLPTIEQPTYIVAWTNFLLELGCLGDVITCYLIVFYQLLETKTTVKLNQTKLLLVCVLVFVCVWAYVYISVSVFVFVQGRVALPNRMIFWKNSKQPLTPPHFRKIILQFF